LSIVLPCSSSSCTYIPEIIQQRQMGRGGGIRTLWPSLVHRSVPSCHVFCFLVFCAVNSTVNKVISEEAFLAPSGATLFDELNMASPLVEVGKKHRFLCTVLLSCSSLRVIKFEGATA